MAHKRTPDPSTSTLRPAGGTNSGMGLGGVLLFEVGSQGCDVMVDVAVGVGELGSGQFLYPRQICTRSQEPAWPSCATR